MNILIIKLRNIGDVLLTTPVIENLKKFYPSSNIDIVLNTGTEEIVSLNPNINKIYIYRRDIIKQQNFFRRILSEFDFFLDCRKKHYDLVINLTEGDRGGIVTKFARPKISIGYKSKNRLLSNVFDKNIPKQESRHTIEANLDALRLLDIPITSKKVKIFTSKKDDEIISNRLNGIERFIHIHPVSRWLFKCISDATMAAIIDFIELEMGIKVVLTSAPVKKEIEKIESIINHTNSIPVNLSGELTLKQTSALNKKAIFFIGVDTAIMHISAANNTPVLAFFGPSGANHWGPWDNDLMNSGYEKVSGFQKMGKHRVISQERKCQPCGKDGCDGSKISQCLIELDLELIKQNIREMIFDEVS